jgi:DNA-binding response OmpR family regulator
MADLLWLILQSIASDVFAANSESGRVKLSEVQSPDLFILDEMLPNPVTMQAGQGVRKSNSIHKLILSGLDTPIAIAEALNIEGSMAFYDSRLDH